MIALVVAVVAFGALSLALAQNWGWATPFAQPADLTYHNHSYYIEGRSPHFPPVCIVTSRAAADPPRSNFIRGLLPLRRVGEVFGYLTDSKPSLLPHYEWGSIPYVVEVPDGRCLRQYDGPFAGQDRCPAGSLPLCKYTERHGWVDPTALAIGLLGAAGAASVLLPARRGSP